MKHFIIDDEQRPYLEVQCGDIAHLMPHKAEWAIAYNARIERVYQSMRDVLPDKCDSILDIGGGLSGIGARLCEHYDGEPLVAVLDGKNTLAVVDKHREPFNNATQTHRFLKANGVKKQAFYAPDDDIDRTFELIVSTQAWCFHIAPEVYLEKVKKALRPGGTLIVDVRKAHPEWSDVLESSFFKRAAALADAPKWRRLAFKAEATC